MTLTAKAILVTPVVKHLSFTDSQKVFIIGDLDGHFSHFQIALNNAGFKPNQDTLICLGDVIDRGSDNLQILEFLKEIDAYMVLGNHEHMMIEAILDNNEHAKKLWNKNGGQWHKSISNNVLINQCEWLLKQPLSIILQYKGYKIGISHTVPVRWRWGHVNKNTSEIVTSLLWDRELFKKKTTLIHHGVDFSIHGHNSTQTPLWIGNSYHIDTSFYGKPTAIELTSTINKFINL